MVAEAERKAEELRREAEVEEARTRALVAEEEAAEARGRAAAIPPAN